VIYNQ